MNRSWTSNEQVMSKLTYLLGASWSSEGPENYKSGWWMGGWSTFTLIIRLSQPQTGDWARAWAELGKSENWYQKMKKRKCKSKSKKQDGAELCQAQERLGLLVLKYFCAFFDWLTLSQLWFAKLAYEFNFCGMIMSLWSIWYGQV